MSTGHKAEFLLISAGKRHSPFKEPARGADFEPEKVFVPGHINSNSATAANSIPARAIL